LIWAIGEPLAAPSANAHTAVSPTTAAHVLRSLGSEVDLVLDGGPCLHGIESTVLDLTGPEPRRILRPGALAAERLRSVVKAILDGDEPVADRMARPSPGQGRKHYSPRARVVLVDGGQGIRAALRAAGVNQCVGLVTWSDAVRDVARPGAQHRALGSDPVAYARGLFAALHDIDAAGCTTIIIERVPGNPEWSAVADRIRRAAAQ
jgi:L-threonylcarbamoyladenylate synthase